MKVPIYELKLRKNNLPYLCKVSEVIGSKKIDDIKKSVAIFNKAFDAENLAEEICMLLCLDRDKTPIGVFKISKGTYKGCLVELRGIFHRCFAINAKYFIEAHNHPSGSLEPSDEDINKAIELRTLGFLFEIPQLDNIIISNKGYISIFKDENMESEETVAMFELLKQLLSMGFGYED